MSERTKTPIQKIAKPSHASARTGLLQRKCACGGAACLTDECADCQHEKLTLQRRSNGGESPADVPPIVQEVLGAQGQPLEPATRTLMEARFGHNFSQVRVYADARAAESARAVRARAYTSGSEIVFGAGEYRPATASGQRLLAHELVHVVQGGAERGGPLTVGAADSALEREADKGAEGAGLITHTAARGLLMRQPTGKDEPAKEQAKAPGETAPKIDEKEEKQREAILDYMLRESDTPDKMRKRIKRALNAFSTKQMEVMKQAGVRFWPADDLPPLFRDAFKEKERSRLEMGRYEPALRIIHWDIKRTGVDDLRHELAHAWDHVRTGKVQPLDKLKGDALIKAAQKTPPFTSETDEKRPEITETGDKPKKVKLSVKEMFDRFMNRPVSADPTGSASGFAFANPGTDPQHAARSVKEFYAEGYSVFHGDYEDGQAQLLCSAPELYQLLEKEAKEQ